MSAYKKFECSLVNRSYLLQGLTELGFHPQIHTEPHALYGFDALRNEKAHIIVPKSQLNALYTGASNDLGFLWDDNTQQYLMICSDYDELYLIPPRIKQAYAKIAIEDALKKQRFHVQSKTGIKNRSRIKVKITGEKII